MRHALCCMGLLCLCSVIAAAQSSASPHKTAYDGNWWLAADEDMQSGFLEGTADCLTWVVNRRGFNGTPDQLRNSITRYYRTHPRRKSMLVTEVWQEVWHRQNPKAEKKQPRAESWGNPHWYLNGDWWGQVSRNVRMGFVAGYLWCVRSCTDAGAREYPGSNAYYFEKVDKYIDAHPKAGDQPIALTLSRFRSVPRGK